MTRNKYLPACVMQGGSSHGTRSYRGQDGSYSFYEQPHKPWRYRSTVNESPKWGLRSGTAHMTSWGYGRFANRSHSLWDLIGPRMRTMMLLYDRQNPRRFHPGKYDRWD